MNSKRVRWFILILLLLCVAGAFLVRYLPSRGVQKELDRIRAEGFPASTVELDDWYRAGLVAQNQALAIMEASKVLVEPDKEADPTRFGSFKPGYELTAEMNEEMAAYVATNQPALDLLKQAADLPESRYPIDLSQGAATLLPHLAKIKRLVILLRMEAVQHSRLGQVDAAVESVATSFALARSLRNEPLLISDLVRIASVAITLTALERLLSEHQLSEAQLKRLSILAAQAEADGPMAFARALAGERAGGLSVFKLTRSELEQLSATQSDTGAGEILETLKYQAYRATGMQYRDLSLYLDLMGEYIRSAQAGFPESLKRTRLVEKDANERLSRGLGRFAMISRILLPHIAKAAGKEANLSARLRFVQIALAVERYRLEHQGSIPERLDQIAPHYIFKVPPDPFTGTSPELEPVPGQGYRITSAASAEERGLAKNSNELGFSVLR